jgi:large conductance mechanosensitive channel
MAGSGAILLLPLAVGEPAAFAAGHAATGWGTKKLHTRQRTQPVRPSNEDCDRARIVHQREGSIMDPLKKMAALDPTKKAFSLLNEFKAFALKGNVIDLAVAVIIGAAFTGVINSLVKDLLMPLLGLILPGEKGFDGWEWTIGGTTIPYGKFLGAVVNFVIVAFALFIFIVKFLGWVMHLRKEQAAIPPLTKDQELLTEIRDLLRSGRPVPGQAVTSVEVMAAPPEAVKT